MVKEDKDACASLVTGAVGLVRLLAALLQPYMPSFSAKLLLQLNLPESALLLTDDLISASHQPHTLVAAGHAIGTPTPLVSLISDDLIESLRAKFGGNQAERDAKAVAPAAAAGAPKDTKPSAAKGGADKNAAPASASAAGKGAATATPGGAVAAAPKASAAKKEPEGPPDVSRLDLRVGLIRSAGHVASWMPLKLILSPMTPFSSPPLKSIRKAWRHPDAESLYVEEIDLGEEKPRQVGAGRHASCHEPGDSYLL